MTKSTYDKVMGSGHFSRIHKESIEQILQQWHKCSTVGKIISKNIKYEHFLPQQEMEELLGFIINFFPKNFKSEKEILIFEDTYDKFCHKFCLHGGEVNMNPYPKFLGHAVEEESFIIYMDKNFGHIILDSRDLVYRLTHNLILEDEEKDILISIRNLWATWNENDLDEEPFEFIKFNEPNEARANLGLIPNIGKMLLFIYVKTPNLQLFRPTIADSGIYELFDPPLDSITEHGWTRSWPKDYRTEKYSLKPRPEALHVPEIKIRSLEMPVKYLYEIK